MDLAQNWLTTLNPRKLGKLHQITAPAAGVQAYKGEKIHLLTLYCVQIYPRNYIKITLNPAKFRCKNCSFWLAAILASSCKGRRLDRDYRPIFKHFVTAGPPFPVKFARVTDKSASALSSASTLLAAPKISKFSKSAHPSQQSPSTTSSGSLPRGHPAFPGASQPSQGSASSLPVQPASSLPGASQQSPSLPARMELYTHIWIM